MAIIAKLFFIPVTRRLEWTATSLQKAKAIGNDQEVIQSEPNKNIKLSSFKSSENIQKKVGGPDSN